MTPRRSFRTFVLLALVSILVVTTVSARAAGTLDALRSRGRLRCGTNGQLPGFGYPDAKGTLQGFDVTFCRALAAAIGVDVDLIQLNAKERFPALQSGEVDVLFRNTTWTFNRDVNQGFDFAGITYYDGQGFLLRKKLGVKRAAELDGASICVGTGTTTEINLADYFRAQGMTYEPVVFEGAESVRSAYESGRCDVMTSDISGLAAQRTAMKRPEDHIILPDVISKEPLGPVTREGDDRWTDIVRWLVNALVIAEERGVTKDNAKELAKTSKDPVVQRLLGVTGHFGRDLGLSDDWALKAILVAGNYGEIFEANIGTGSPLGLERGLNALWRDGGLLYAPPMH